MRTVVTTVLALQVAVLGELSEQQIKEAIELGRARDVPIVQVGTLFGQVGAIIGVSKGGDFNVFIEGPVGRIAAAAAEAFRQYRPFEVSTVTKEMKAPLYRAFLRKDPKNTGRVGSVEHIVLQPRRAKGLDGVVQPVKESIPNLEAFFDHFPDGEFDVVVATSLGPQKYAVTTKDRAKIR